MLSSTPIAVLIALSLRSGIRLLTIRNATGALLVAVLMLALGVVACLIAYTRTNLAARNPEPGWQRGWLLGVGVSSVLLFVVFAWSPECTGTVLAPWAAVFAFAMAMALGLTALVLLGDSIHPGPALAACGLKRLPVIAIVALSFLGTAMVDDQSAYHATRLLRPSAQAEPQQRMLFTQALDAWAARQPDKPEIPLVFVASSGGGIRAAYWMTLVPRLPRPR